MDLGGLKTALEGILTRNIPSAPAGAKPEVISAIQTAKQDAISMADDIADAINAYVTSRTVKVTAMSGSITVVGSPSTQTNATPIVITGDPLTATGGIS